MDSPQNEDKSKMLDDEVDEVVASLGNIALVDKNVDEHLTAEKSCEDDTQKAKLHEKSSKEKTEKNIEIDDNHSNESSKGTEIGAEEIDRTEQSDRESKIREHLLTLQCPLSWKWKCDKFEEEFIAKTIQKVKEIEEEISFQWRHFILTLILCNEYYRIKDIDSAFNELRKCEALINSSDSKGYFESFFQATKNALLHLILGCKCYLYLEKGNLEEMEKILKGICKEEDMDNPCKAALWGIKAAVAMEYGYEGTKMSVQYVEKALELDKEQAEWHFLLGKCLGRIRRIDKFNEVPAHEELKALEEAVKMARNPSYIIFLAQCYREAAFKVYSLTSNFEGNDALKCKINQMNLRSYELYQEALEFQGNCSHVNMRCAQGFHKLPYPYQDLKLAKECCEKAMRMAPDNPMVHHIRGSICNLEKDYEIAKRHYKKAGELGAYGAYMDLMRIEYIQDSSYDPVPLLESMLIQYKEVPRTTETLCQLGSYYFFIKNDMSTALRKYWLQVIQENPQSEKLKIHKSTFLHMRKPVNIYELLYDEARLALRNTDLNSDDDIKLFREIIDICLDLFPELDTGSPIQRRKMILDESRRNGRKNGGHRGRGGRGGRSTGGGRGSGRVREQWRSEGRERSGGHDRNENGTAGPSQRNTHQNIRTGGVSRRGREQWRSNDRNENGDGSSEGNSDQSFTTRFVPRNRYTDSRPGQRFNRRNDTNWRERRDDE